MSIKKKHAVIIGAGPAGLTAGIELLKNKKFSVDVLERDSFVGGLARTTEYKGCRYDIGPHHFITHAQHIEQWWKDLMKDDFHEHKRFTRIYYKKHFFHYPLEPLNVLKGLNPIECFLCIMSYIRYRMFPIKNVTSFQDWITNRFGYRLFSIFFRTYTEKVWGIKCDKISSDWASQRIKGFSLSKAIFYAFFGRFFKKNAPRTLRDTFHYPSKGSGTLWEKAATKLKDFKDGNIYLNNEVVSLDHDGALIKAVSTIDSHAHKSSGSAQSLKTYQADYFFSTMPLKKLISALDPLPEQTIIDAANALKYRGLITVNLIVDKPDVCPDHWLYVHEKEVMLGRVGNMNNFSLKMVDNPNHSALSLEYFSFVGSDFWKKSDKELFDIGSRELEMIGLVKADLVLDGMIMRTAEAYPVYDENYTEHLSKVLNYLKRFENLQLMGRNGMHRYNNMDIAMLSALDAVERVEKQEERKDFKQREVV